MKFIAPAAHRLLDYGTVIFFCVAPTLFRLTGRAAILCYALSVVHLAMTVATHFPDHDRGLVPFRLHTLVEVIVGLSLIGVGLAVLPSAETFFITVGAVILLVALCSAGPSQRPAGAFGG
ncbi:MAG TPA: hypothetical protein VH277_03025 [Gemmatimonadaceae bacterium]|nr:hypothetical protein [Gemmatimonadaceae bacterium]